MFEKLPSLLGFKPKFYTGGPTRFHLPLLYDLVASKKPRSIVTLGFGDGQAFFAFCQATREQNIEGRCVAVRRERAGEKENDDVAWLKGKDYGQEFYADLIGLHNSPEAVKGFADESVDLLLIDDSDSGVEIRSDLSEWEAKLAPNGVVLVHGIALERGNGPKTVWLQWSASRRTAEFPDGIGLGLTLKSESGLPREPLLNQLFGGKEALAELAGTYRLAVARMEAEVRADEAVCSQAALEARQVWTESLLADRWKVQEIMDHQARAIADLEQRFQAILTDRAKAQLIMDSQHEQLSHWVAETEKLNSAMAQLKAQIKEQKRILNAAKKECRKNGRCFQIADGPKEHRPFAEKVLREIRRLPRNLGISRSPNASPSSKEQPGVAPDKPVDRYAAWISEHEADAATLEAQRRTSQHWPARPKISLLMPVYNTPAHFLDEMFVSVSGQTYDNWELCVVDGGTDQAETLATLQRCVSRDSKIHLQSLARNFGISENTNRALELATGDFVACIDHDDLLAPFALYELARAIGGFPDADIFYSDEDRLSEQGKRHAPFFKPEWSPELLQASMYIGHLTAYRRTLVDQIGGFRKEFDLAQDYDFALRATERARAIRHIPHVLYHWREHPASGSTGGKPDARKVNLAALADAMRRRNLAAEIIEYSTANRARLEIGSWPRVSIIVPTDSPTRAQILLSDLPRCTNYPDLEIIVVTNSQLLESLQRLGEENAAIRFVAYDKPFNFSEKCNRGADAATGERLIFFNDDVETQRPEWIQNLIEPLENPEVGAVAPKLLYETGKIQHAGLVMGVRGLAGTAFHQREADSTEHYNLAQSLRDVAALSAACLAMRREDFVRLGGFDAVNTPIAHSDIDLCFRIREAGMRCVYTPYATLSHAGHASISLEERVNRPGRDKASIYLLKRWPHYTTHDPYFTNNMRDWLYSDSPTPIRMAARDRPASAETSIDLLFVSHDLSLSGAPMMLFHAARWCQRNGIFTVVMAPKDGPLREKLEAESIPLIIDPLIRTGHESFASFARDFDCIVANTIRSGAVVRAMQTENVPIVWWLHEPGSVGEHYIREDTNLRAALPFADMLVAPSERTAEIYRPFTDRPVKCLRNAIPDLAPERAGKGEAIEGPLRFLLLASIEPRKGQDIFVQALALLPRELQEAARFQIAGRILDPDFWPKVKAVATTLKNFSVSGALNHEEAIELMSEADVVVSASRDEAMPTVTILEAMSLGKAVIATTVGGAREVLVEGENSLLVRPENPAALADAIRRLIKDRSLARELGRKARLAYEKDFTMERFGIEFRKLIDDVMAVPASAATRRTPRP
jgi:glycosyltransferase involved in cell wall biosynthesis/cellulose synthase/poly-beta-1,6-N-acetylglucosamine synthase-like glycosyltransferase